jgi:DNA-binding NtrC family response regulator
VTEKKAEEEKHVELLKGNGELLLIVDDEPSILELCKTVLERNNYWVYSAKNGAEAVTLYAQNKGEIKLILIDQIMPIMDGPSTIKVLKTMNPDIKIIAMSGLSVDNVVSQMGDVKAFIIKPFSGEKLLRTIRDVLNS